MGGRGRRTSCGGVDTQGVQGVSPSKLYNALVVNQHKYFTTSVLQGLLFVEDCLAQHNDRSLNQFYDEPVFNTRLPRHWITI